jgi:hypothetical protein
MAFSIQTVLRQISIDLLKEYFGHKAPGEFDSIWKLPKSKQAVSITKKQAVSITKRLVEIDDDISQSISADLARIHPLSTERGRKALLNAAAGDETLSNQFGRLGNDYERALWTLMKHLEWFEYCEGLTADIIISENDDLTSHQVTVDVFREAVAGTSKGKCRQT